MDRGLYLNGFSPHYVPRYRCPHCNVGHLMLLGEFFSQETERSKAEHSQEWWDPEMIRRVFSCTLKCGSCDELVMMVGEGRTYFVPHLDYDGQCHVECEDFYYPKFFCPSLKIISYPKPTPDDVRIHIDRACTLFFSSPDACANSIRSAAEVVLTHLNVPSVNNRGKFMRFVDRIEKLDDDKKDIKTLFNAIRWLGNYGSHGDDALEPRAALDAFIILDHLLDELYGERQKVMALAADINECRGPSSRRWI